LFALTIHETDLNKKQKQKDNSLLAIAIDLKISVSISGSLTAPQSGLQPESRVGFFITASKE
jgi:hypothetical protein